MAGRADGDQQEQPSLPFAGFWNPVRLYGILEARMRRRPVFLPRTASYSATPHGSSRPPPVAGAASYLVSIAGSASCLVGQRGASAVVIVALAAQMPAQAWLVRQAFLVRLAAGGAEAATAVLDEHAADDGRSSILLLYPDGPPDLGMYLKAPTRQLTCRMTAQSAFGVLPVGSRVLWCVAKPGTRGPVELARGRLRVMPGQALAGVVQEHWLGLDWQQDSGREVVMHTEAFAARKPPARQALADSGPQVLAPPGPQIAGPASQLLASSSLPEAVLPRGAVFFRWLSDADREYRTEATQRFACPLCAARCRNLWGLRQHVEACHSLLRWGFPEDHPEVLRVVDVRCPPAAAQPLPAWLAGLPPPKKAHAYYCPPGWLRAARLRQYGLPLRQRRALPRHLTAVAGEDAPPSQRAPPPPKPKPKPRRARNQWSAAVPRVVPGAAALPLFHARSHTPMPPAQVAALLDDPGAVPDSDDEQDVATWKERRRRRLRRDAALSADEREFMLNWDLHLQREPILADAQVPASCLRFAADFEPLLAGSAGLRRCFVAHLLTLWEHRLLGGAAVDACLRRLPPQWRRERDAGQGARASRE